MYDNIGGKIKGLARFFFVVGLIVSVIGGILMIGMGAEMNDSYWSDDSGNSMIYSGVAIMILGPLSAWISTFILYGFGELVAKTCEIEGKMRSSGNGDNSRAMAKLELMSKIEKLYEEGSISEEEYKERKKRIFDNL